VYGDEKKSGGGGGVFAGGEGGCFGGGRCVGEEVRKVRWVGLWGVL